MTFGKIREIINIEYERNCSYTTRDSGSLQEAGSPKQEEILQKS